MTALPPEPPIESAGRPSSIMPIVGRISAVIFVAEAVVMFLFAAWPPPLSNWVLSFLDSLLLVLFTSVPLYFWVVKPHEDARDRADWELERERSRLEAEVQARRDSESGLRKLTVAVEQSPISIVITDAAGLIEYVNPRFCELTGYSRAEVLGQNPRIQQSGETPPGVYAELWETITAGRVWHGEFVNLRKDGSTYQEQAAVAPIFGEEGEISHYVATKLDITAERALEDRLRQLATTDPLTGIGNRRAFLERLEAELARSYRYGRPVTVLMLDIDHFKEVNDTHGHGVGDEVIKGVVAACARGLRENDVLGRLGGEEFGVLLPETGLESAAAVAERVRREVGRTEVPTESGPLRVTMSVGVAALDPRGAREGGDSLLARADRALYRAKEAGRDRVERDVSSAGAAGTPPDPTP